MADARALFSWLSELCHRWCKEGSREDGGPGLSTLLFGEMFLSSCSAVGFWCSGCSGLASFIKFHVYVVHCITGDATEEILYKPLGLISRTT